MRGCCFFDAFGTLIYPEPDAATVYYELSRKHGDTRSRSTIADALQKALSQHLGEKSGGPTDLAHEVARWKTVVESVFDQLPNRNKLFDELWNYFADAAHWRIFPDVLDAFKSLHRAEIEIGVATNFDQRIHALCNGLSPLNKLPFVFSSVDLGWRKPALEFFQEVSLRSGFGANELWLVGDDLELDVIPALQSGWHTVLMRRNQPQSVVTMADGTLSINSLARLPTILLS